MWLRSGFDLLVDSIYVSIDTKCKIVYLYFYLELLSPAMLMLSVGVASRAVDARHADLLIKRRECTFNNPAGARYCSASS